MDTQSAHIIASALNNLAQQVSSAGAAVGGAIFVAALIRAFFNK